MYKEDKFSYYILSYAHWPLVTLAMTYSEVAPASLLLVVFGSFFLQLQLELLLLTILCKNLLYCFEIDESNWETNCQQSLPTVNGQWTTANCQWSTVNGQWTTVNCQWSIVNCQQSTVTCQQLTVNCHGQLSTVNCQQSTVNSQLPTVNSQLPTVNCQQYW